MNLGLGSVVSGLNAQSRAIDVSAQNVVNAYSTGSLDETGQQAYVPQDVDFVSQDENGVRAVVKPRDPSFVTAYAPDDVSANDEGFVAAPNVDLNQETYKMLQAEQAYKASAALVPVAKDIYEDLINAVDKNA